MADYDSSSSNPPAPSNGASGGHPSNGFNGSVGGSSHESTHYDNSDGFVQILARQFPLIAAIVVASVLLSIVYLMVAKPVYTSTAKLRVEPLGAQMVSSSGTEGAGGQGQISADFLATECDVISSNPVLALALGKLPPKIFEGVKYPIDFMKSKLTAEVAKKGQTIDISFDSNNPEEANLIVNAVVEAYQSFESDHWKNKVKESLTVLEGGQQRHRTELNDKTQRMLELARKYGITTETDPDKNPLHEQVRALSEALTKAHLETIQAKSAYEEAASGIIGDPAKVQAVEDQMKLAAPMANPQQQLTTLETELFRQQTLLADAQRQYMPNHPITRSIQNRIDQLTIASVAAAGQWQHGAQAREEDLQSSLQDAQKKLLDQDSSSVEYVRLQAEVNQLKKMDEVVENRVKDLDLIRGAGATNITVLDDARIDGPPAPHKKKTLAVGLVLGAIAALGIACIRDWMDDRLRTPEAVKAALNMPVIGAVPIIGTAFTAADRGQIVHNDPFGEAAESYRTLRTALQFGLPKGVKTLLITSPASGDGKSTLVSNLAIAIAQTGKRVLVIDADFRAPMQHRLFGVKDRVGFATVLGNDEPLAEAIQRTEVEGLDVLPCGPIPPNPAEMLNSQQFNDHLNDLADKYDLILIDSPPVTAVADARILAACADATMLVVRPDGSTRRHTIDARDGLRSVGARIIGVAVNRAHKRGNFAGGASGYYSRYDQVAPNQRQAAKEQGAASTQPRV